MRIGFFGDSFCADVGLGTYPQLLANHYGADVVHVGHGGSSIWDVLLLQIDPFIKNNNIPDICVFVWTEPYRFFHRVVRNITATSAVSGAWRSTQKSHEIIYEAARDYYLHLHDPDLDHYRYTAALHYFDTVILPAFPKNTKIVHLWSYGNPNEWHDEKSFLSKPVRCDYQWQHGIEIHPSFTSIIVGNGVMLKEMHDQVRNHVTLGKKFDPINSLIFNRIKDAIDQQ